VTPGVRPLRAITFDYWDTIYVGAEFAPRKEHRRRALYEMLAAVGCTASQAAIDDLLHRSAVEADRWWREEHRGYTADERIRWVLARLSIERPQDCEHVAAAVRAVDEGLLAFPPPLFPGADRMLVSLAPRTRLAIISDTGFASGRAQDALLARSGLLDLFEVTVYSMDIGHAKPRPEPFRAALAALGLEPAEVLHVGDNERTDVGGALAMGLRAVRVDITRQNGITAGEYVARSIPELERYLSSQL
jgi:putative hydrolase of the HAD superfamily